MKINIENKLQILKVETITQENVKPQVQVPYR